MGRLLDETWWSRLAQPTLMSWTPDTRPLRLVERTLPKGAPKARAAYGLLVRAAARSDEVWLRFVEGRPVSGITTQFLAWCADRLAAAGKTALLLVWDQAAWHPIEPTWVHGKRRVVEPAATLTPEALAARVYAALDCHPEPPLTMPQQVA